MAEIKNRLKDLKPMAKDALQQAENKARQFSRRATNELRSNDMFDDLEQNAYAMGRKAKDALTKSEDMAKDSVDYLESQVRENPFVTVGLTFVLGMIVGKLFSNDR